LRIGHCERMVWTVDLVIVETVARPVSAACAFLPANHYSVLGRYRVAVIVLAEQPYRVATTV